MGELLHEEDPEWPTDSRQNQGTVGIHEFEIRNQLKQRNQDNLFWQGHGRDKYGEE